MIPIGIVTRNRHTYLDVTLRSLSGTDLPDDQAVIVFDDASDNRWTQQYLYTEKPQPLTMAWPATADWRRAGLGAILPRGHARGLRGLVRAERLSVNPLGVVRASCAAICRLYSLFGTDEIIIMQDDVVLKKDWLALLAQAKKLADIERLPGLIAGLQVNKAYHVGPDDGPMWVDYGHNPSAQLLYCTEHAKDIIRDWAMRPKSHNTGFDNKIAVSVRQGGSNVYVANPPVGQHFGTRSLVRPKRGWYFKNKKGRVDYRAQGPYELAPEVRAFA